MVIDLHPEHSPGMPNINPLVLREDLSVIARLARKPG